MAQGGSAAQLGLFLLLAALPVTGALAAAALRRADALLLDLMLLPVVVLLALAGAAPAVPACLLLFGRLDGGVGGFLLGAAAGLVGQARYRKLPPEPLPPL